ncbi:DUF4230 domain-containing protein [Pseudobutyrivibrio xylanivorans]|uniref:DUF4230 domain-containing protein n=1 Tax=Pseudobutyrivibrio xylanivorans TaxID=185007 RepID=A0A5P6VTT1_PSEXY|nr:DUF4230 domain-containing protein [Pseudobutyrivibrio xylanivorans]QFJ55997.1 DUF4230 domain-containing protein [Pseudobutyrivibrio xylanivorans]
MKKIIILRAVSIICIAASLIILFIFRDSSNVSPKYSDGITVVDPNTIVLSDSGVRVSFSDVILSKRNETRKLVVYEQEAEVSYEIEDRLIEALDWDPTKKHQKVTYKGKGSFIVNLDSLTKNNLIDDKENKILTIKIKHPILDTIEIDPYKIKVDNQTNGLLALGKIKLTVADYNVIEKELKDRLKEAFDNSNNGQKADDLALKAVYDIYNPIVKAVDSDYKLKIEFE